MSLQQAPTLPVSSRRKVNSVRKNNYPEHPTKPHNVYDTLRAALDCFHLKGPVEPTPMPKVFFDCGRYITGHCTGKVQHKFVKAIVCGREWCPVCGADESATHKRRISRWMPYVMQINYLGYFVITVPEQLRETFKDKKVLSDFRTFVKRKFQRLGYSRGLTRYHYAGEDYATWKPHLNILVEEGFLPEDGQLLKRFRKDLAAWFNRNFEQELKAVAAQRNTEAWKVGGQLNYGYCKPEEIEKKVHRVKYITRATLRTFDSQLAWVIKKFRTTSPWGKWNQADHVQAIYKHLQKNPEETIKAFEVRDKITRWRCNALLNKKKLSEADLSNKIKKFDKRIEAKTALIKFLADRSKKLRWELRNLKPPEELPTLSKLENNICHVCDAKIHWHTGHRWCPTCGKMAHISHKHCENCDAAMKLVRNYINKEALHSMHLTHVSAGYFLQDFYLSI